MFSWYLDAYQKLDPDIDQEADENRILITEGKVLMSHR